jgi:nucleoside-diphosphate-sugar epimerase
MILVTGGAGYVGSLLVPELLALGERVRVVDTFWFGNSLPEHPNLEVIKGDLRLCDPTWLEDVHAVIHLSGLSNDPTADFAPLLNSESNVFATRNMAMLVAQRARSEGHPIRFIFASSCSIYYTATPEQELSMRGKTEDTLVAPTANYSKTKRLGEVELLRLAEYYPEFCPVIMRKGTLFGMSPRMRFDLAVNVFTLNAWQKRQLTVFGSGEAWRPLLHIRDAVDAYIYSLSLPLEKVRGQIFNLVHKNYRVLEVAHWITEVLEKERNVSIQVKRDRSITSGERSYYVLGNKIEDLTGFRAERGIAQAVLDIWDALEAGKFGQKPQEDPKYFNIRWLKQNSIETLPPQAWSLPSLSIPAMNELAK